MTSKSRARNVTTLSGSSEPTGNPPSFEPIAQVFAPQGALVDPIFAAIDKHKAANAAAIAAGAEGAHFIKAPADIQAESSAAWGAENDARMTGRDNALLARRSEQSAIKRWKALASKRHNDAQTLQVAKQPSPDMDAAEVEWEAALDAEIAFHRSVAAMPAFTQEGLRYKISLIDDETYHYDDQISGMLRSVVEDLERDDFLTAWQASAPGLQSLPDPILPLRQEWLRLKSLITDETQSKRAVDRAYDRYAAIDFDVFETRATTPEGALASIEWAREEFVDFYAVEAELGQGERFILALLDGAIAALRSAGIGGDVGGQAADPAKTSKAA